MINVPTLCTSTSARKLADPPSLKNLLNKHMLCFFSGYAFFSRYNVFLCTLAYSIKKNVYKSSSSSSFFVSRLVNSVMLRVGVVSLPAPAPTSSTAPLPTPFTLLQQSFYTSNSHAHIHTRDRLHFSHAQLAIPTMGFFLDSSTSVGMVTIGPLSSKPEAHRACALNVPNSVEYCRTMRVSSFVPVSQFRLKSNETRSRTDNRLLI